MNKRIITISRECGSGGHTIGKLVAEALSLPFYDKLLLKMVAQRSGLSESTIEEQGEHTTPSMLYNLASNISHGYNFSNKGSMMLPDQIFAFQAELIKDLAEKEACVIVGRCCDYILRDRDDCLHVFIHAEMLHKINRLEQEHRVEPGKADIHAKELDKKRSTHYNHYTDRKWGNAQNYDLCLNSGTLGIDKCVEVILAIFKSSDSQEIRCDIL